LAVTGTGILALDHANVWHPYHRSYLGRNYFRIDEGVGPCGAPAADTAQTAQTPAPFTKASGTP
jgi:hypothetical protein